MNIIKQYNKIGENYIREQAKFFQKAHDVATKFILNNLPKKVRGLSVLDLGCGAGRSIQLFKKKGFSKIYGIDSSSVMIKAAKTAHPDLAKNLTVNDIQKLPFKNKSFDIVTARFCLHYVKDLRTTFKEISRVLKPNGRFIFVVDHPLRDLMNTRGKKYGHQEIIKIHLYHNSVTLNFPSHTLNDYFSETFFKYFNISYLEEGLAPDQGKADKYNTPDYLAVLAIKK